jgi:hypothetical protein
LIAFEPRSCFSAATWALSCWPTTLANCRRPGSLIPPLATDGAIREPADATRADFIKRGGAGFLAGSVLFTRLVSPAGRRSRG